MILLTAVDDRNGLLFHRRRQSQDRVLRETILSLTGGKALWMSPYSAKQFAGCSAPQLRVEERPLEKAGAGEFCFLESAWDAAFAEKLETVILFRWNRHYPADTWFDLDLSNWRLTQSREFQGYSHEKLTMEVYERA